MELGCQNWPRMPSRYPVKMSQIRFNLCDFWPLVFVDFLYFLTKYTWYKDSQHLILKLWVWTFWLLKDIGLALSGTEQEAWNKFVTLDSDICLTLFVNFYTLLLNRFHIVKSSIKSQTIFLASFAAYGKSLHCWRPNHSFPITAFYPKEKQHS